MLIKDYQYFGNFDILIPLKRTINRITNNIKPRKFYSTGYLSYNVACTSVFLVTEWYTLLQIQCYNYMSLKLPKLVIRFYFKRMNV